MQSLPSLHSLLLFGDEGEVGIRDREDEGFIKVLTKRGSDQVVGVTIVASHAGDLVHELALAMKGGLGLKQIAGMIHIYPTLAEATKRAADTYQRTRLTPRAKRVLRSYLRLRFG